MSENVAYCLEYLNKEGTEQTWLFIRMVDTFFGYLNVKSTLTVKTKLKPSRELYRSSSDARFKVCLIKHKYICNVTDYPGIAGLVLTVGMAVDANVIIFERIREELREGRGPRAAIAAGFQKARWTILDANITTLITAVILFQFGTGPIKGFAVTLSVGILASVFAALVITRLFYSFWPGDSEAARLSI